MFWLSHRIHVIRIGLKYGWPSQKRAAIKKLLLEGTITQVCYLGGSFNPEEEFSLLLRGPFGTHIRWGKGRSIRVDPQSVPLPPEVASAFGGYVDRMDDVVYLLWYLPLYDQLKKAKPGGFKIGGDLPQSLAIVAC